jgi:ATP-dependent RNA helicase SUPV3L1/SUV3
MPPVLPLAGRQLPPPGYRALGRQALRLDMAEKLLHAAHAARVKAGRRDFVLDPALAVSMGLATAAYAQLLRLAGFQAIPPRSLPEGAFGPLALPRWRWRPPRRAAPEVRPVSSPSNSAFAALAGLVR